MGAHPAWDILLQLDMFWGHVGKNGFALRGTSRAFCESMGDMRFAVRCVYRHNQITKAAGMRLFQVPKSLLSGMTSPMLFSVLYEHVIVSCGGLSGIAERLHGACGIWRDELDATVEKLRLSNMGTYFRGIRGEAKKILYYPKTRARKRLYPYVVVPYRGWYRVLNRASS